MFDDWPLILIDLHTEEGIVGRSYLEPYLKQAARYLVPAIMDLTEVLRGHLVAPFEFFRKGINALHLVGREGLSMIAVAGLDMAAWDALAQAADMPLAVFLGGTLGPVPAYNSNGLWPTPVETLRQEAEALVEEGGFTALKLRLGRDRLADDLAAIAAVRQAAGEEVKLMCDFNQGLSLGDALQRCHALDDQGLFWFEEPIVHDNLAGYVQLTRELKTPVQLGENFYGPRAVSGDRLWGRGLRHARPDAHRGRNRLVAFGGNRWRGGHSDVHSPLPRGRRPPDAGDGDGQLAGMAGLCQPHSGRAIPIAKQPSGDPGPTG